MSHQLHGAQIIGRRSVQQDAVHVAAVADEVDAALLVVCDGMGGHSGGEVASQAALAAFLQEFQRQSTQSPPEQRLRTALAAASRAIVTAVAAAPSMGDMGTTLAACFLRGRDLAWVSVGDSPIRLLRDANMIAINDDHSMAPVLDAMAASGEISRDMALTSSRRHVLRSALTATPPALIDGGSKQDFLRSGDLVMVASDGINTLADDEIRTLTSRIAGQSVAVVVSTLLDAVEQRALAHQDNASIAACRIGDAVRRESSGWRRWFGR